MADGLAVQGASILSVMYTYSETSDSGDAAASRQSSRAQSILTYLVAYY